MKRVLISYACLTLALALGPLGRYAHAQTAPSAYSAYTGTDTKPIPPAPALGPANSVIVDPTFGSQILRVTDENTNGGQSLIPIDAGFFRAWNANSTAIKLTGPGGQGYWIEFDPNTFKVGDGSSRPVIHPVSFGSRWEWSTVDPDTIYFLNGNQIGAYNKSTGVTRNLGGPPTGEPVAYFPVVIGRDDWVCAAAGSGIQDSYTKMFCVNPVNTGTSKFIDVLNKTINGVPQPDPWPTSAAGQTIGIHSVSGGTGASWLEVTFHGQNWGANGGTVFNLSTNTWSFVTNADPYWSGHLAMGNGKYVNSSGSINGRDSRSMVIRNPDNLMNSANYLFIEKPPDTLNQWCDVDHSSWLNSMSNPNAPVLVSRYTVVQPCQFAWSGEIIAAAVDGSNTVWRFAHNHSTFNCYYGEGFAQISNDGKWALFSSYWDGRLGPDSSFGCGTRIDTFIVRLVSPSSPTAPTGLTAGATGESQINLSWTASTDDVGVTGYQIERCQGTGCSNFSGIGAPAGTGTTYTDAGLSSGTTYSYRVRATDSSSNLSGYSNTATATTASTVGDTTPPVISSPTVSSVTTSSVTISWTTNEASDSQVDYGTTAAYGSSTTLNSSMVTSHAQSLNGLTPNTTYHFHMKSKDAAGNLATSADFTFTTAASGGAGFAAKVDFQPAGPTYPGYLVESGSQFGNRGNGFTYGWNAWGAGMETRVRNSSLSPDQRYDTLAVMGDAAWEIAVPNGTYVVHVVVGDADYTDVVSKLTVEGVMAINGSTSSSNRWLETTVTVSVSDGRLTITNLPGSYNKICYVDISGSSSSPPSVAITSPTVGASFTAPANVAISANASDSDGTVSTVEFFQNGNLLGQDTNGADGWSFNWAGAPAGTYSVTARATDNSGMQTTSSAVGITVGDTTPPVISGPTVSSVTTSSATINWTTNEASNSQVDYGTTAAYGSSTTLNSSMVTSHAQSLNGLTPNTTYHFHMKSKDAAGNLATSADFTFTTAASGGAGFAAKVDFQPAGSTYPGYLVESGSQFADRGNGFSYGWNMWGVGTQTRTRNSSLSPDQRYDTFAMMGDAAWEMAVPNGTYVVHVVVGDPEWTDVVSKLTLEGVMAINGTTNPSNRWLEATVTVSVSDGRLTVTNLAGSYNKICYVDISAP